MRTVRLLALALPVLLAGCSASASKYPTTSTESLALTRVFLYRNGVGYFEREGHVDGDVLRIKVRKDQVNDLLKSLTVVNRHGGQAVSVSMPLDPQTWANAALAILAPGRGNLSQVLDTLRGTAVVVTTAHRTVEGRIVMVEEMQDEPDPEARDRGEKPVPVQRDHRVTLLEGSRMNVVRLSQIQGITLRDGDLAMQVHRSLDASAGEGMFQQVEVSIRLVGQHSYDLAVSYVVSAPMWKPTYRVVLPTEGHGKALLQGWAVVDNVSGEEWNQVHLGLTSGAPIAFRYDLHTPRDVERSDLTEVGVRRRASVAVGETSYAPEPSPAPMQPAAPPPPPTAMPSPEVEESYDRSVADSEDEKVSKEKGGGPGGRARAANKRDYAPKKAAEAPMPMSAPAAQGGLRGEGFLAKPVVDADTLRRSTLAQARSAAVSGLTQFVLDQPVTVPDGSSTMVAVINQAVEGEETFLFRPGGAGSGYESNPYRVVRFKNETPFVLEPGPISIYAGGSFVGEGISESVGAGTSATIPFAVEPNIMVTSLPKEDRQEMKLLRVVRGVLEVETYDRKTTVWTARAQSDKSTAVVLIRHPKAGSNYSLVNRPKATEDLPDAYLVPVTIPKGRKEASVEVVEQTPSQSTITIWDSSAPALLEKLVLATSLTPDARQRLEPIVQKRREYGRIEEKIQGLQAQRSELDQRAGETRGNLEAIKKDPAAAALRAKLSKRLEQFSSDGDRLGREVVELQTKLMELRVELGDLLENLDLTAPTTPTPPR